MLKECRSAKIYDNPVLLLWDFCCCRKITICAFRDALRWKSSQFVQLIVYTLWDWRAVKVELLIVVLACDINLRVNLFRYNNHREKIQTGWEQWIINVRSWRGAEERGSLNAVYLINCHWLCHISQGFQFRHEKGNKSMRAETHLFVNSWLLALQFYWNI